MQLNSFLTIYKERGVIREDSPSLFLPSKDGFLVSALYGYIQKKALSEDNAHC